MRGMSPKREGFAGAVPARKAWGILVYSIRKVIMLNHRDEYLPGTSLSWNPGRFCMTEEPDKPDETCPFCGRNSVRVETFETMDGPIVSSRLGFFTCLSCGETWSDLIDG